LSRGGNGVETDVSKEDHSSRAQNAEQAAVVVSDALRSDVGAGRGDERCVIGGVHETPANTDDDNDDGDFENDDKSVNDCGFLGSFDEEGGERSEEHTSELQSL